MANTVDASRRSASRRAESGRGLWIVYQLCDLVELRSTSARTDVRIHVAA